MSQAEGVLLLLRNTPQALADQPWILAPLERAVGDAACYAGLRGEAAGDGRRNPPAGVIRDARRCRPVAVRGLLFDLGRLYSGSVASAGAGRRGRPTSTTRSSVPAGYRGPRAAHRQSQRVSWHLGPRFEPPRITEVARERE